MESFSLDRIRRANPVPHDPDAPALATILTRREVAAWPSARGLRRRSWPRRTLFAVPAIVLAALAAFALIGGPGEARLDVAAALYRALTPGAGVLHYVSEEELDGRLVMRVQHWSTQHPPRERNVSEEHGVRVEGAIAPGGVWTTWASAYPDRVERTRARGTATNDDVTGLRRAYREHLLRVSGKLSFHGRPAYRLTVVPRLGKHGAPTVVIVDARSFLPIEVIDYAHGKHGGLLPQWVIRYRAIEELPDTAANLAHLKLAAHPGAHLVERG